MALQNRARLRKTVRRSVRNGWERAIFARPGGTEADTEVLPGPEGPPSADDIDALVAAVEAAAARGLLKLTFVIDPQTRVRVDARYGKAKILKLDEARALKAMGGKVRALEPEKSAPLLRVIGLMNADGTISTKHAKKYKQVNHFVELCRPAWERLQAHRKVTDADPLRVLDLACGNSYLTFVLGEALRVLDIPTVIHGVDRNEELVARSRERAAALAWSNLSFEVSDIASAKPDARPDIVIALHACDTATDEALALAVHAQASVILAAPCCQRELAAQLGEADVDHYSPALLAHGLLRRDYASTLTDALRIDLLDACGYKVDAVEFVGSEHTPKNLLIRAHRRPKATIDLARVRAIGARCATVGVKPRLLGLLDQD